MSGLGKYLIALLFVSQHACTGTVSLDTGNFAVDGPGGLEGAEEPIESQSDQQVLENEKPANLGEVDPTDCQLRVSTSDVRLLTTEEVAATFRALGATRADIAESLLPDGRLHSQSAVPTNDGKNLNDQQFASYAQVASSVAPQIASVLSSTNPCLTQELSDSCFEQALVPWVRLAFRRTPSDAERAELFAFAQVLGETAEPSATLRLFVEAILQTPDVLYHRDEAIGDAVGRVDLRPTVVASNLAYLLTGAPPSDAMLDAFEAVSSVDESLIESWTRQLTNSDDGRAHLSHLLMQWTGASEIVRANKSLEAFPSFDATIAAAMYEETASFVRSQVLENPLPVNQWLSEPWTPSAGLAGYYGEPTGADAPERKGLLMQGSWLATHASSTSNVPTHRGKFVVEELLCFSVPLPTGMDVPLVEEPNGTKTTRERFEAHGMQACANGCHSIMDPPGFAFEHFDAAGQLQEFENGKPIDASGDLRIADVEGTFSNANDMVEIVQTSERYQQCVPRKWFELAMARPLRALDDCAVSQVVHAFSQTPGSLEDMLVSITTHPAFTQREAL